MSTYSPMMVALVDGIIADARQGIVALPEFRRRTEPQEVWFELAFCIASSQDRSRRALSAAKALAANFDELRRTDNVLATVNFALSSNYVSLRFMTRKASQLAASWTAFQERQDVLVAIDQHFDSPAEAREYLIDTFAGIGPKQASMLLRNLGWGSDLAIIDSHVARISQLILPEHGAVQSYSVLEGRLREFASEREISLQALDVILWSCARLAPSGRTEEAILV